MKKSILGKLIRDGSENLANASPGASPKVGIIGGIVNSVVQPISEWIKGHFSHKEKELQTVEDDRESARDHELEMTQEQNRHSEELLQKLLDSGCEPENAFALVFGMNLPGPQETVVGHITSGETIIIDTTVDSTPVDTNPVDTTPID